MTTNQQCSSNTNNQQNIHQQSNNPTQQQTNNNMNFANVVKNQQPNFPNKNQGIILNAVDGLYTEEYVLAVGAIIGPEKITHYSKLSHNRINIYLNNKQTADEFVKRNPTIHIKNNTIIVRHLLTPNKRIVISNACPTIPHNAIENELRNMGLKITSQMNFLRAGIQHEGYSHILSFRRHVYIEDDDKIIIPESILITHDNNEYRIYITDDSYYCTSCKKYGHKIDRCRFTRTDVPPENTNREIPQSIEKNTQNQPNEHDTPINNNQAIDNTAIPAIVPIDLNEQPITTNTPKRSAPSISSIGSMESLPDEQPEQTSANTSQSDATPINNNDPEYTKFKTKKPKRSLSPSTPIENWLRPAQHLFKSKKFILTYAQFYNFTESVYNSDEPLEIAREFTSNIDGLLHMMHELHSFTTNRSARSRLTKTSNKIHQQLKEETTKTK